MRATPSTWPDTIWPPSSSPTRSARSRLTAVPSLQSPRVEQDSVSAEACTEKAPGFDARRRSGTRPSRRSRRRARSRPCRRRSRSTDRARRPVLGAGAARAHPADIGDNSGEHRPKLGARRPIRQRLLPGAQPICRKQVRADRLARQQVEPRRLGQRAETERVDRRHAVAAEQQRRMQPDEPVHQAGAQQRQRRAGRRLRPAAGSGRARRAAAAHRRRSIRPASSGVGVDDLDAGVAATPCAAPGRNPRRGDEPGRDLPRLGNKADVVRDDQIAVERDPHRRAVLQPRQGGRSVADRRPAPSRSRPGSHRAWRAADACARAPPGR